MEKVENLILRIGWFAILFPTLAVFFPLTVTAADFRPAVTVLKMHVHVEVNREGLETIDETLVMRIERKDAVNVNANHRIEFSPKMHRVEIVEAFTSTLRAVDMMCPKTRFAYKKMP